MIKVNGHFLIALLILIVLTIIFIIVFRKRKEKFYESCGGSCKTDANCAEGMKCKNGKCCV